MQHSAIKEPGENIRLFAKTNNSNNECLIWKLNADETYSQIQYTPSIVEISDNLYYTDYVLPDTPCTIIVLFKKQPIVISVGNSDRFFVYYGVESAKSIQYEILSDDGDHIETGTLSDMGNGFYFKKIQSFNKTIILVEGKTYPVRLPYPDQTECRRSGRIKIENNTWQLISIPVKNKKVKEYFVDRLANKYEVDAKDIIEICTAYFGDENRFRSYIPDVTNELSDNNFPLVYSDSGNDEITGFWVKTKDMSSVIHNYNNVIFEWSSE